MRYVKLHGCGNDYVFVDARSLRIDNPSAMARLMADRHRGVGSDGLILVRPAGDRAIGVSIYNADGSRALMCGNGVRCAVRFACEAGMLGDIEWLTVSPGEAAGGWCAKLGDVAGASFPPTLLRRGLELAAGDGSDTSVAYVKVVTDSGVRGVVAIAAAGVVRCAVVDMGVVSLDAAAMGCTLTVTKVVDFRLELGHRRYDVTCVSTGNPHAVIFVDDLGGVDVTGDGRAVEACGWFRCGVNVHFVEVLSRDRVRAATWERGSGRTLACGSGACAVVGAGRATGRTDAACAVQMPGGRLDVAVTDRAYLLGPVETACRGEWDKPH